MSTDSTAAAVGQTICPIVFASDDAFAMPLATTLRSLVDSNPNAWPIDCYILSDGISEATRFRVVASLPNRSVSIRWIPVELTHFGHYSTLNHVPRVTYARLLISEILSEAIHRILYLDSDLLVLEDLAPLCRTDLGGAVLGAVVDTYLDAELKRNSPQCRKVPHVADYFNAGVLLIDLDQWRKQRTADRAIEYLTRCPDSPYSDQDALNVACDRQWSKLDGRWNFQDHCKVRIAACGPGNRPAIVHFVTERKPWVVEVLSVNAQLYDSIRNQTCFARTRGERLRDGRRRLWLRSVRFLKRRLRPRRVAHRKYT